MEQHPTLIQILESWLPHGHDHTISVKHRGENYLNVSVSCNGTKYSNNFKNTPYTLHTFTDGSTIELPDGEVFKLWLLTKIELLEKEVDLYKKEQEIVKNTESV